MTENCNGATGSFCKSLHVIGKGVHLYAVALIASKGAAQCIDADVLRLDVASGFVELRVERCCLDLAAFASGYT